MKTNRTPILVCNGLCGIIQLTLAFIVRPFLILAFPLLATIGVFMGYKYWTTHWSNQYPINSLLLVSLLNLSFFIFFEIIHLYNPADVYTLELTLTSIFPLMFWNFIGFGGLLAMSRLKMQQ